MSISGHPNWLSEVSVFRPKDTLATDFVALIALPTPSFSPRHAGDPLWREARIGPEDCSNPLIFSWQVYLDLLPHPKGLPPTKRGVTTMVEKMKCYKFICIFHLSPSNSVGTAVKSIWKKQIGHNTSTTFPISRTRLALAAGRVACTGCPAMLNMFLPGFASTSALWRKFSVHL